MLRQRASATKFSARVIELAITRGLTVAQIAKALDLSESMVSHVRAERKALSLETLTRAEDMLNMHLGSILLATFRPKNLKDPKMAAYHKTLSKFSAAVDAVRDAEKASSRSRRTA